MELDLWNDDFQLAREWGLDIPVPVSGGQFGDLKSTSYPAGDTMTAEFQDGSQILHSVEDGKHFLYMSLVCVSQSCGGLVVNVSKCVVDWLGLLEIAHAMAGYSITVFFMHPSSAVIS